MVMAMAKAQRKEGAGELVEALRGRDFDCKVTHQSLLSQGSFKMESVYCLHPLQKSGHHCGKTQ